MSVAAIVRYLAVPLQIAPLLLIGTFSALLVVAASAGIPGIPLGLILLSWFAKYSFVLMDRLAEGAVEPPVLSLEMVNPVSEQRPLIMLLLTMGAYFAARALTHWAGAPAGLMLTVVAAAILPAMVAVQGATGTVIQSLNPRTVLGLIWRLRGDYLVILGFMALAWIFGRFVLESAFGGALPLVVRLALLMYAWLATFSIIGGVLFERRLDIGLEDVDTPESVGHVAPCAAPDERL